MRSTPFCYSILLFALAAVGCGDSAVEESGTAKSPRIVVAIPMHGPNAKVGRDIERSARMQFEKRNTAGALNSVKLVVVDESSGGSAAVDPESIAGMTQDQIDSGAVVGWVGGVDSDALAVELPRLNEAGIAAVSPSSTATPFNRRDPAFPGSPIKYYPAFARYGLSFARTAPTDLTVAGRCLDSLRGSGIRRVFTVDAGDTDGDSFSSALEGQAPRAGVTIVGHESVPSGHADWEGITQQIAASGAQSVVWGSAPNTGEHDLWTSIASSRRSFEMAVGPAYPPASLVKLPDVNGETRLCSASVPAESQTPSSSSFAKSFRARWGHDPSPGAIRGAAAMSLMLKALHGAVGVGASPEGLDLMREGAVKALSRTRSFDSLIGRVRLDRLGNWNIAPVGIWALQGDKVTFSK